MSTDQLEQAFGRLDTQLKANQRKKAQKTLDEILRLAPGDADALRCKAVLHVEQGSFDEALKLIASCPPDLAAALSFERAYCLYRQGKLQEALQALAGVGADRAAAVAQLEAQLQYRLGNYGRAIELYSGLLQAADDSVEVQTNAVAAYVAGGRASEVPGLMQAHKISARDSFEVAFNAACGLVEAGQLAAAEEGLALAQRVGEEALYEEGLEEEEVALEMAPIAAQLAYVADRLGRRQAAVDGLRTLLALDLDDEATAAVAANNLYALLLSERGASSAALRKTAGEGAKRLEVYLERSGGALRLKSVLESRLGAVQREAVLASYATAQLLGGKPDVARQAVAALERGAPNSPAVPALQASLLSREGKCKEADAVLAAAAAAASGAPGRAAELTLARAQLMASAGDLPSALALLQGLPEPSLVAQPAVLATRLAILEYLGRSQEAAAELEGALKTWQAAPAGPGRSAALAWIVRQLAGIKLKAGDLEAAAAYYAQLSSLDGSALDDPELMLRHARLLAATGGAPTPELAARVSGAAAALSPAEVDGLENAPMVAKRGAAAEPAVPVPASKKRGSEGGEEPKAKRKRKRKPRYPKGFDPANPGPPPDPERWLPKWQRSDAKKLRKKMERRGKEAIKGSQGAGKVDDMLDRSNAPMPEEESKGKAAAKPPPGAKGGKKKGRR